MPVGNPLLKLRLPAPGEDLTGLPLTLSYGAIFRLRRRDLAALQSVSDYDIFESHGLTVDPRLMGSGTLVSRVGEDLILLMKDRWVRVRESEVFVVTEDGRVDAV